MNYIIWGAGDTGVKAMGFLGHHRVSFFADKNKVGEKFLSKPVISVQEMIDLAENSEYIIVVASVLYQYEMIAILEEKNIKNYISFNPEIIFRLKQFLPWYDVFRYPKTVTYTDVLSGYQISKYKNIIVYGVNLMLPYLLAEIKFQAPNAQITVAEFCGEDKFINCLGLEIKKFDINSDEYDCVILNVRHNESSIRNELENLSLPYDVIDVFSVEDFEPLFQHPELKKYKDLHKGKRCFIVATGPSLRIEDLEKLHQHNEICLSMNKVYRSYSKTNWRANYLGVTDPIILQDVLSDFETLESEIFIGDNGIHVMDIIKDPHKKNINLIHLKHEEYFPNRPRFSNDITKNIYWGNTVTYDFALQVAAYMGFSQIYLIGVDNCTSGKVSEQKNHFIDNYFTDNEKKEREYYEPNWDATTKAYEAAEIFSRENGFRIYNATRGGKLEVFERVEFDSLFE